MKGRVRAEGVGFIVFVALGVVKRFYPEFPLDDVVWWSVAGVFILVLLWELCFLTPYEHVKALTDEHKEKVGKLDKEIRNLRDTLADYDHTPVFPIIETLSNSEPICVTLLNKGREAEPIESVCLYLEDGETNEAFRLISEIDDGKTPPLIMPGKTNLRIAFDICGAHCIQWGVKSVFAVVSLQDRRQRESERFTIRNSSALDALFVAPAEHSLERTWEQSMVRHKRIHKVAQAYRIACSRPTMGMAANRLRDLSDAQIRDLEDDSEVHELFAILNANKVPHPFRNGESDHMIRGFYTVYIPAKASIGGIMEWNAAYNSWFDPTTPLSPTPER